MSGALTTISKARTGRRRMYRCTLPHAKILRMSRDGIKTYLLSLPERLLRSGLGLGAGVAREIGDVVLPDGIRHTRLYQNLVDTTLRFLIEQVGGVEGAYPNETPLPDDFLKRRTAGN